MLLASALATAFLIGAATTCTRSGPAPKAAFYYWKTGDKLNDADADLLQRLAVDTLYLRFFDLDWDAEKGQLRVRAPFHSRGGYRPERVVPVVFITRSTLEHLARRDPDEPARFLRDRVQAMLHASGISTIDEIQLDCDWEPRHRETYFALIDAVRRTFDQAFGDVHVSVTIRLYQLRHRTTAGIPPADSGALMFYHTGSPRDFEETNAILDNRVVKGYLRDAAGYPLPIQAAYPTFSWAIQFTATKRFLRLVNEATLQDFDPTHFREEEPGLYRAITDHMLGRDQVAVGDYLRIQRVEPDQLRELVTETEKHFRPQSVLLFDYDRERIRRWLEADPQLFDRVFAR
ncbi:hypothetical protein [Sulfidibacter corallicola]|uniref:Uncharacterized protein n=1 Tax=Sulfidibacter corallicola TaxID=2818388 RepID=A0A8A4TH60_SULCO|nr:hypothetical protein [Sulfidibacter corallicola]QTD49266.1 hypothetical protein J3U87_27080 [Sulfidibacter corallicola]